MLYLNLAILGHFLTLADSIISINDPETDPDPDITNPDGEDDPNEEEDLGPINFTGTYDSPITYELGQDTTSGLFYLYLFVGSQDEKVELLIDTMATGNAIKYKKANSETAVTTTKEEVSVESK